MKRNCRWLLFIFLSLQNYCHAQVTVTGSVGVNATYSTLSAAFTAINGAAAQTGANILLNITADVTEPAGTVALTYKNWTTLTIQPTGARTISGAPTVQLIGFNGARFVTINGINSGGNTLLINCTNTLPALTLYNAASNNTIKNCTVKSNANTLTSGVIFFSNTTAGGDNNNAIDNCDITANISGTAVNLLYSNGTAGAVNKTDTIRNCRLYDNFNATGSSNSILLDANNDSWVIENNHFYQTANRTVTSGAPVYAAININGCLGDNFKINNNAIGGTSTTHTGYSTYGPNTQAASVKGIILNNVGPAVAAYPSNSYVTNNTIKGIQVNSNKASTVKGNNTFVGIEVNNGATTDEANITNNMIGGVSGTDLIKIEATSTMAGQVPCAGIYNRSSKGNIIEYNTIGTVTMYQTAASAKTTTFDAIYSDAVTNSSTSISYNSIGGSKITTIYSAARVYGIELANTTASGTSYTVMHNSIHNLEHTAGNVSANYPLAGINCVGGGDQVSIAYNTIYFITLTGSITPTDVYAAGIRVVSNAAVQPNRMYKNFVFWVNAVGNSNSASGVIGMSLLGNGTHYAYNNMISVGESTFSQVIGINQNSPNTLYLYNNSVYVVGGGSGSLSCCLRRYDNSSIVNAYNNIFRIDRSDGYGINFNTVPVNATPYTGNNNIFYTPAGNTAIINGNPYGSLASLQAALPAGNSEGSGSKEADVDFPNLPDLHTQDVDVINAGMNLLAASPLAITDDFDDEARNACFDIGADETYIRAETGRLTWTGTVDTKWCTACNWDKGISPDSLHTVYLDAGSAQYPVIDAAHNCSATVLPHADSVNIASGATLTINSAALEIYGQLNNDGVISNTGGSIGFASSIKDQQINSTSDLVFNNLYIKGLSTKKYLNRNTTVNTFAHCAACSADLLLGTNNLTVNNSATGSLNSHIVTNSTGNLILKNVTTAKLFPIGPDETKYNPLTIANGNGKDYSARVEIGINPGGTANPLLGVNRTWNITASATPAAAVDVTFGYYNADVNGLANPTANMYLGHYYTTPIPIWNIDQGNQPVTPGAPNTVLFNIANWNATNPFVLGNLGFLLASANQLTLSVSRQGNACLLLWNIAGSDNVAVFEMQRSADGVVFNSFGLTNPVTGSTAYRFTDMYAGAAKVFYRIKMTTRSGEIIYSNIAVAQVGNSSNGILIIYPSPATSKATVLIRADKSQIISYSIFDTRGMQLLSGTAAVVGGLNMVSLNLRGLPAGDYFIKMTMAEGKLKTGRFMKE